MPFKNKKHKLFKIPKTFLHTNENILEYVTMKKYIYKGIELSVVSNFSVSPPYARKLSEQYPANIHQG